MQIYHINSREIKKKNQTGPSEEWLRPFKLSLAVALFVYLYSPLKGHIPGLHRGHVLLRYQMWVSWQILTVGTEKNSLILPP